MTIFHYRGGTIDEVAPLAKTLKAYYLKHGVTYRLSRFQTGPNAGYAFKKLRTVLGILLTVDDEFDHLSHKADDDCRRVLRSLCVRTLPKKC